MKFICNPSILSQNGFDLFYEKLYPIDGIVKFKKKGRVNVAALQTY